MNAAPHEPADLLQRLRQQLLLSQVRVMEMEDERDTAAARLADQGRLLDEAQRLADAKLDEADHLARTLAALQAEFQHLRHIQHVTNEALQEARAARDEAGAALAREQQARAAAEAAGRELAARLEASEELGRATAADRDALRTRVGELGAIATSQAARIVQLDAERRALKASRSWRWTAWLRALERALGPRR